MKVSNKKKEKKKKRTVCKEKKKKMIGVNMVNNEKVAIKFESKDCEVPQLKDEYRAYKLLNETGKRVHFA